MRLVRRRRPGRRRRGPGEAAWEAFEHACEAAGRLARRAAGVHR